MSFECKKVALSDIADLTVGFVGTTAKYYVDKGIRFLRSMNVEPFKINFNDEKFISKEFNEQIKKSELHEGDVVIVRTGKPGACAVVPQHPGTWNCSDLVIIHPDQDKVDSTYLAAFINLASGVIHANLVGAVQQHFNVGSAKKMIIDLPPMEIQRKISRIIDTLNGKLHLLEALADNLNDQISTLYHAWFETFEAIDTELVQSDIGPIPSGWKVVCLSEVTENIKKRVGQNEYKVLSAVSSGILQPSEEYFTKQVYSKDISKYIVVEEGCLAYNPARINIGSIGFNDLGYTGCVSPVYVVVKARNNYHNFLRYFVKTERFNAEVQVRCSGSVRQSMNYADFGLIQVAYPPEETILEFNAIIAPIQAYLKLIEKEHEVILSMRDAVLPELMSGNVEL